MKALKIGVAVSLVVLTCSIAAAAWFTDDIVRVRSWLTVGTATKSGMVSVTNLATTNDMIHLDGIASQTGDFLEANNSSGTVIAKIDVNGAITTATAPVLTAKTADPCNGTGFSSGSIFYNTTDKTLCYCNNNTGTRVALEIDASSDNCF